MKRLLIVLGFVIALVCGINSYRHSEAAALSGLVIYWLSILIILWIIAGFQENKK